MASASLCFSALSEPTTTSATPSVVMWRAEAAQWHESHDQPVLPDGDNHKLQGAPCSQVDHIQGAAEETWNGGRSQCLCSILIFGSRSNGYKYHSL